ncbi:hypothetical protein L0222_08975 [bacterium]|nr:hypothetical protein [bacterium]
MQILGHSFPTLTNEISTGLDAVATGISRSAETTGIGSLESAYESFSPVKFQSQEIANVQPMPAAGFPDPVSFLKSQNEIPTNELLKTLQDPRFNVGDGLAALSNNLFGGQGIAQTLGQLWDVDPFAFVNTNLAPDGPPITQMKPEGPPGRELFDDLFTQLQPEGPPITELQLDGPPVSQLVPDGPPTRLAPDGPPITQLTPDGPPSTQLQPEGPPGSQLLPEGPPVTQMLPEGPPSTQLQPDGPPTTQLSPEGPPQQPQFLDAQNLHAFHSQLQTFQNMEVSLNQSLDLFQQMKFSTTGKIFG